jgi:hypothetical protein
MRDGSSGKPAYALICWMQQRAIAAADGETA